MKKFKVLRNVFAVFSLVLSHAMCTVIAYSYASMICAIQHKGASAPADIVFFFAIPYIAGIIICVVLALVFNKKARNRIERIK